MLKGVIIPGINNNIKAEKYNLFGVAPAKIPKFLCLHKFRT